jgi:uncharacterized protein (DUF433 family)
MTMTLAPPAVSVRLDETGTIRVGPTRVTLDTLVAAFHAGATPEQIVQDFPTLDLADVYSAIGYYLHNRKQVEAYIADGERRAEELRREVPGLYAADVRARLLARRDAKQAG